jgi:8-oxo-dGTP pyrophosphatase MutT (NUDIX family)
LPPFRRIDEQGVYDGRLITVARAMFEAPDGDHFEREIVHHPGAVVMVPMGDDGEVTLVRQFRAAVGKELLEIPAGKRDVDGEPPEATAARELAEEVGLRAGRLDLLARFYNSPGFSDELSWCYLATDLMTVATDLQGIEEQHMSVERVALRDLGALITDGRIIDAKTIVGLSLAAQRRA